MLEPTPLAMPARRKLELEVAQKAVALGVSVLQLAVAPNVLRVAQTALRAVDLVRSAVRRDRDRERCGRVEAVFAA